MVSELKKFLIVIFIYLPEIDPYLFPDSPVTLSLAEYIKILLTSIVFRELA